MQHTSQLHELISEKGSPNIIWLQSIKKEVNTPGVLELACDV